MTNTPAKAFTWLFNPFHYVAGVPALIAGLVLSCASAFAAAALGLRFDGLMKINLGATTFGAELAKLVIFPLILSVLLLSAAKLLTTTRFRLLDLVGTQYLARWPFLALIATFQIPGYEELLQRMVSTAPQQVANSLTPADLTLMVIVGVISLGASAWSVVLMYRSYQVSCNVKGGKAVTAFCVAFVLTLLVQPLLARYW